MKYFILCALIVVSGIAFTVFAEFDNVKIDKLKKERKEMDRKLRNVESNQVKKDIE